MPAIIWSDSVLCPRCGAREYPDMDRDNITLDDRGEFLWKCGAKCGYETFLMISTTVEFAFADRRTD